MLTLTPHLVQSNLILILRQRRENLKHLYICFVHKTSYSTFDKESFTIEKEITYIFFTKLRTNVKTQMNSTIQQGIVFVCILYSFLSLHIYIIFRCVRLKTGQICTMLSALCVLQSAIVGQANMADGSFCIILL